MRTGALLIWVIFGFLINSAITKSNSNTRGSASRPSPSPSRPSPSRPAPSRPAPSRPAPSRPAPSRPAPSRPAPSRPAPSRPAPSWPAPSRPAPSWPAPSRPAPSWPAPSRPAPSWPAPSRPAPSWPAPTRPAPSWPAPRATPAPRPNPFTYRPHPQPPPVYTQRPVTHRPFPTASPAVRTTYRPVVTFRPHLPNRPTENPFHIRTTPRPWNPFGTTQRPFPSPYTHRPFFPTTERRLWPTHKPVTARPTVRYPGPLPTFRPSPPFTYRPVGPPITPPIYPRPVPNWPRPAPGNQWPSSGGPLYPNPAPVTAKKDWKKKVVETVKTALKNPSTQRALKTIFMKAKEKFFPSKKPTTYSGSNAYRHTPVVYGSNNRHYYIRDRDHYGRVYYPGSYPDNHIYQTGEQQIATGDMEGQQNVPPVGPQDGHMVPSNDTDDFSYGGDLMVPNQATNGTTCTYDIQPDETDPHFNGSNIRIRQILFQCTGENEFCCGLDCCLVPSDTVDLQVFLNETLNRQDLNLTKTEREQLTQSIINDWQKDMESELTDATAGFLGESNINVATLERMQGDAGSNPGAWLQVPELKVKVEKNVD